MRSLEYGSRAGRVLLVIAILCQRSGLVVSRGCRAGWLPYSSWCYRIVNTGAGTANFDTAGNHCRVYGAHVVSIHSQEENNWIYDKFKPGFIGTFASLGFHNPSTTEWVWSDGSSVNYTNWYINDPVVPRYCAFFNLDINSYEWWSQRCNGLGAGYICKIEAETTTPHLKNSNTFLHSTKDEIPSPVFAVASHSMKGSGNMEVRCAMLCGLTLGCRGFNLDVVGETCVLLNININDESREDFLTSAGTAQHYIRT